jgi:hypothetical protein
MDTRPTFTVSSFAALGFSFLLAACPKDDPGTVGEVGKPKPDANMQNVVKVEVSVPWGKRVACADLLDPVKIAAALGEATVEIKDITAGGEKEATSICSVKKTGDKLTAKQQEKLLTKEGLKLGVQPGDEICQLKAYCSYPYDLADMRKSAEADGQSCRTDEQIGDITCTKQVQAGADYRHIVSVLDPDSRCRYVVSPTTITEEAPVKACAKAFVDTISKEQLKVQP